MPEPLLGPNIGGSSVTHGVQRTQRFVNGLSSAIPQYACCSYLDSGLTGNPGAYVSSNASVVSGGGVTPAFAGIAINPLPGDVSVNLVTGGTVKTKVTAGAAKGDELEMATTGGSLPQKLSAGKVIGKMLSGIDASGFATILIYY